MNTIFYNNITVIGQYKIKKKLKKYICNYLISYIWYDCIRDVKKLAQKNCLKIFISFTLFPCEAHYSLSAKTHWVLFTTSNKLIGKFSFIFRCRPIVLEFDIIALIRPSGLIIWSIVFLYLLPLKLFKFRLINYVWLTSNFK